MPTVGRIAWAEGVSGQVWSKVQEFGVSSGGVILIV